MLEITPEIGVPFPKDYSYQDLRQRVEAACNSVVYLQGLGADYDDPTMKDKQEGATLAAQYAASEENASKQYSNTNISKLSPQAIVYAASILDEYGHRVAESSQQIRNLVTTKLLHETENADPKVRLKALELLGKISDVGLFSDKTEVTVTHQTSDELKSKLKAKLERLINPPAKLSAEELQRDEELASLATMDISEGEYTEVSDRAEVDD
jgi:hypothetical protein